ncbi:MAG: hypothetical protein J0J05_12105 [Microbacterium sp.]|uniref:hypothetical protein n=1 Tax=Microbacterium sp. TaxID=51671 RepID=UPI001AC7A2ED|nr:hypothetical protein [Microbacterium sp.]MBN9154715.1 hypothetical protein [Microbacterium sp.]
MSAEAYDPDEADLLIAQQMAGINTADRHGPSDPLGAHVIDWRHLSDSDARAAWDSLRAWVDWFVIRYRIAETTVPPCWYRHGQLVEELSALHVAHGAAFDSTDSGFGPIGWHERLSVAMPRLTKAYAGGCTNGHRDVQPRAPITIDEQEWDAWTTKAHAH